MTTNALYIGVMWLAYYGLHSAFAADGMKRFFARHVTFAAPYYRIIYSFFAVVNFILLGWFHIIVPSERAFQTGWVTDGVGGILAFLGAVVFWKAAAQYGSRFLIREEFYEHTRADSLRTDGVNRYVRHPLYSSILLLILALALFFPQWKNIVFVAISALYVLIGAKLEEAKLLERYGDAYREYQQKVKMLIPYLF